MAKTDFWQHIQKYLTERDRIIFKTTKDPETIKSIKIKYNLK